MTVTTSIQQLNLEVTGVGDVIVTDIQQDPDVGDYVRDIRIFEVTGSGVSTLLSTLIVQIRIRAPTRAALDLTAPPQQY